MAKPIKIQHPTPQTRSVAQAILPIGMYCNKPQQTAKIGDEVQFHCEWRKDKLVINNICRFRINTPEFTFMLRSSYGDNMTIAKLMERWEAWAVVEGIGKDGIDKEQCIIVEVKEDENI